MAARMDPTRPGVELPPGEAAEAVTGDVVRDGAGELVEVTPTPASKAERADRARGRTAVQVGVPTALVILGTWAARLLGLDLDPNAAGVDMPAEVVGAWVAVLTVALAFRMNPRD